MTSKRSRTTVQSEWLTLTEAATYMGVHSKTLRRRVSEGNLPAVRMAGSRLIRVRRSDLDALLTPIPTTER
jgi:excisionase family DNA binding protein